MQVEWGTVILIIPISSLILLDCGELDQKMSDDPQRSPEKVRSELALESTTAACVPWQGYLDPCVCCRQVVALPLLNLWNQVTRSNVRS